MPREAAPDVAPPPPVPDPGSLLDAGLALVGLPLEPELRPRVLMHLSIAVELAGLITGFPLSDEAEPAPVYRP